jgi:hypothetical protein
MECRALLPCFLRSVHADGALLGHSAGFLPCICIDILNTIPVPGKYCFCQEHIRLLIHCETIVLPVCACKFYTLLRMYIVDMNVQGFTVCGFPAVSGMKIWNEYGIESTLHKRQAVRSIQG